MTQQWRGGGEQRSAWKRQVWWVRQRERACHEILAAGIRESVSKEDSNGSDNWIFCCRAISIRVTGDCPRSIQPGRGRRRGRSPCDYQQGFVDPTAAAFLPRPLASDFGH